jgi:hypothetical protein
MVSGRHAVSCTLVTLLFAGYATAQPAAKPRAGLPAGSVKARPSASAREPAEARPTATATPTAPVKKPPTKPLAIVRDRDVAVPLEIEPQAGKPITADRVKISSGEGRITSAKDGTPVLEMPVGESAVVSTDVAQQTAARSVLAENSKTQLPWLVVETRESAEGASVRTARPFVTLAKAILWKPDKQRHVAEFLFGLDPETGAPGPLDHALSVRFVVTCDEVVPAQTRVRSVGPGGYGTVSVECSPGIKNDRAEHELGIFVERGNLRYPFQIPRRPGRPLLSADSAELHGFGFSSATLTLISVEEDGSPLVRTTSTTFQLLAQGGRIDASDLTIPNGQSRASVVIHPHGLGSIEVVAALGDLRSAPLKLELAWPVLPLLAMFFGGTLGGFATTLRQTNRRKVRRRALEGAVVGLVISAFSLLVPSFTTLPSWAPRTELGLFVLAALAGFVGTPLLDRASQTLFPTVKTEESS